MSFLCRIGLHRWRFIGSRGLVLPSHITQCTRCQRGRETMWTGTLSYSAAEMHQMFATNHPSEPKGSA